MGEQKGKDKISFERKFILILIHTPLGLNFFNRVANSKVARIYASFSIYLMPLITALGIFLILTSLIVVSSNSGARAGQRDLGPQSNLLIPGLNPYLPWTYGWIALIITIVIHEAGHGIVARVYNIKVDSTGILLILGLPVGAFVNIAQEELARSTLKQKSAILTAGPLNNMILVVLSLIGLYCLYSYSYSNEHSTSTGGSSYRCRRSHSCAIGWVIERICYRNSSRPKSSQLGRFRKISQV